MPVKVIVNADIEGMSEAAANLASEDLEERLAGGTDYVLGLATGQSPIGLYHRLAFRANQGAFDCRRIRTFNLDEYAGLPGHDAKQRVMHPESYAFFMTRELFGRLDTRFFRSYLPGGHMIDQRVLMQALREHPQDWEERGTDAGRAIVIRGTATSDYLAWVRDQILQGYEDRIGKYGGIDLQVIGVGEKGHVAFHEAGIPLEDSRMLLVRLDDNTMANAVADGHFPSRDQCPHYAVSMGVELVFEARKVVVLASGARKTRSVTRALLGDMSPDTPLSYGQAYSSRGGDLVYVIDKIAGAGLLEQAHCLTDRGIHLDDRTGG